MHRHLALPAALFCFAVSLPGYSAELRFQSGPARVTLVELYTSEGCSSCPPAEAWLNGLENAPGLWREFVPVAFHVNYWDHLGWKDALASRSFTDREHAHASAWRAASVYTPCFVRNGEEWRPRDDAVVTRGKEDAGGLVLRWRAADSTCVVEYTPAAGTAATTGSHLEVSVVLLGGGIATEVRRGENSGRTLRHEFVALRWEARALAAGSGGVRTATLVLPPRSDLAAPRRALAAWVTRRGSLAPLQAVGGWLE